MKRELPARPNLEQLKNQAKDLLNSCKQGASDALERIREYHPRWSKAADEVLPHGAPARGPKLRLSDAQVVIAREYGFASWPKLKEHVEASRLKAELQTGIDPLQLLKKAFHDDDAAMFRRLLEQYPAFKAKINEPVADFNSPIITAVRSREMLDVLLDAGADINAKSNWWAGGFGLLHSAKPALANYAIERGAKIDVHAAARLGRLDKLRELISANPELVNSRGGDGQTPLHFASSIEIVEYLLDHGAEIDARDIDHESTPAQYMVRNRKDVARYLITRGCQTDILMAAALGDEELVRKHLRDDPECIRMRVSDEYFPMVGGKTGGTIYQWELGWYVSAHQVAKQFGHEQLFRFLVEQSPPDLQLVTACWLGDEELANGILARHPNVISNLSNGDRRHLAHAARNDDLPAFRLMLKSGFPIDGTGQHAATPLHWGAWHGNTEMIQSLIANSKFQISNLEQKDRDFNSTPLGWAIHASEHGWHKDTGDYAGAVEMLLNAGAKPPDKLSGTEEVQEVLQRFGVRA